MRALPTFIPSVTKAMKLFDVASCLIYRENVALTKDSDAALWGMLEGAQLCEAEFSL